MPKNKGQQFETRINRMHKLYQSTGRAWTWHTYPPFIVDRRFKNSKFNGRLIGDAPPDYLIFTGDWFFMMEAKTSSSKNRFPWSNVAAHQSRHLSNIARFGGIGLVFIRSEVRDRQWLIDWQKIAPRYQEFERVEMSREFGTRAKRGQSSIEFDDLETLAICSGSGSDVDYLDSLLNYARQIVYPPPPQNLSDPSV